jgi:hypothetical protein
MEFKVEQKYRIVDIDAWWDKQIYGEGNARSQFENGDIVEVVMDEEDSLSFGIDGDVNQSSMFIYSLINRHPELWHDGCVELIADDLISTEDVTKLQDVKFVQKHPLLKFEQYGDLTDLQFLGLDKIFKCTWTSAKGNSVQFENDVLHYEEGDIFRVKLGFAMLIPKGKTAKVYMRSGTCKNFNVRLTNHVGCIDNSYNGTNDEWLAEFEAIGDGKMTMGERILQFE